MNWDAHGQLSIVVQGALFHGNFVETANNCRHWRALFPQAQIVLSISVTDIVEGPRASGQPIQLTLISRHKDDGHLQIAVDAIMAACDIVTLCDGELPLPPIKSDTPKLNNMNHQIAAAQAGLALATGVFVLRVRADLLFLDRSFLDQYESGDAMPRGGAATLKRRVLISWLYTLNPYTVERMPLHLSDWFHFGLTEDVRRLWDIPRITFADSVYFRTHAHAPHSNKLEKFFNIRLAVEQHLAYHAFHSDFPELTLEFNNDLRSVDLAMDIFIDNFIICDVGSAKCLFDKYSFEFNDPAKTIHCITRSDWVKLVEARDVPYTETLSTKIKAASATLSPDANKLDFPRVFSAFELRTAESRLVEGEIVSSALNGLVFFGPYTTLQKGAYVATVEASSLTGAGSVTLRVLCDGGATVLAEQQIEIDNADSAKWHVSFLVRRAEADDVEVQCRIGGNLKIKIASLTFTQRELSSTERLRSLLSAG